MGRSPPFYFFTASRLAPQRWGATSAGARPVARMLTKSVRALKARAPRAAAGERIASFKWLAWSREGPGAESEGKE